MPDAPQPFTGYDTALGTLQLLFENKAKGLYPSNSTTQVKYIARHFAKHLHKIKAGPNDRLSFLGKLRAVTKGSRGYLDDEGDRPKELKKPDAGWYLVYTNHVALGNYALGAYDGQAPAYEGGTWCFGYRHKNPAGKIVEDLVRCVFETNQREWMKFESTGMTSIYHFSRGENAPDDCWLGCDGFVSHPVGADGAPCRGAHSLGHPRAMARFHSVARPVSFDLVVYDERSEHYFVWAYDSKGKVFNAFMYRRVLTGDGRRPFCPHQMIAMDVYNICHDGVQHNTDLADEAIHFDDFEDTNKTEKSMVPLLNAKAKTNKALLQRIFLGWAEYVETKDGCDPAHRAKRLRVSLAAFEADGW